MKRLLILLVVSAQFFISEAQETPPAAEKGFALSAGVGILSATDVLDRHLSQDLDGYKNFQYKIGFNVAAQYQLAEHWGINISWTRGGTTATKTTYGSGKYKQRDVTENSFSLLFERRFSIHPHHYFYWGIGGGILFINEEKVPTALNAETEKSDFVGAWPQWKPIGVCFSGSKLTPYFETGLFSLPLFTAGLRMQL